MTKISALNVKVEGISEGADMVDELYLKSTVSGLIFGDVIFNIHKASNYDALMMIGLSLLVLAWMFKENVYEK